jgi:hypothetical protein
MPLGIKSIALMQSQTAQTMLYTPGCDSLGMVAMISQQRLNKQAAGSASRATFWPLDQTIMMR